MKISLDQLEILYERYKSSTMSDAEQTRNALLWVLLWDRDPVLPKLIKIARAVENGGRTTLVNNKAVAQG